MHTWENQTSGVAASPQILGNCKLLNLGHNHMEPDMQISRLLNIYAFGSTGYLSKMHAPCAMNFTS